MNTSVPPSSPGDTTGAPPPPPQPDGLDRFFLNLRNCGLYRSDSERWIGGVCGGLAERLRVDPLIIRAVFVLLGLVFGAGITIYLIAWVLLPDRSGTIILQRAMRGGDGTAIALVIVAAVIAFSGFGLFWGWSGPGPILPVLLIVGLLVYLLGKQNQSGAGAGTAQRENAFPAGQSDPSEATPTAGQTGSPAWGTPPSSAAYAPGTEFSSSAGVSPSAGVSSGAGQDVGRAVVPYATSSSEPTTAQGDGTGAPQYYSATSVGESTTPGADEPPPPGPPPGAPFAWGPPPPPTPPTPRRRRLGAGMTLILLGIAAIVGSGTVLVAGATELADVSVRLGLAAATVTVGIGVIAAGFVGRKAGLAAFTGLMLACVTAVGAMVPRDLSLAGPHGQEFWTPATATSTTYRMGAGQGELDLRGLRKPTTKSTISARVALGELRIIVPDDLSVRVKTHVDGGQITTRELGSTEPTTGTGEWNGSRTFTLGPDTPVLTVDADVGYGEIIIERSRS